MLANPNKANQNKANQDKGVCNMAILVTLIALALLTTLIAISLRPNLFSRELSDPEGVDTPEQADNLAA